MEKKFKQTTAQVKQTTAKVTTVNTIVNITFNLEIFVHISSLQQVSIDFVRTNESNYFIEKNQSLFCPEYVIDIHIQLLTNGPIKRTIAEAITAECFPIIFSSIHWDGERIVGQTVWVQEVTADEPYIKSDHVHHRGYVNRIPRLQPVLVH